MVQFLLRRGRRLSLLACLLAATCHAGGAAEPVAGRIQEIAAGWRLKSFAPRAVLRPEDLRDAVAGREQDGWLRVRQMPSMVHDVLLDHGRIQPPWLPGQADACRWVAEQDWVYAVEFSATDPDAEAVLQFQGLDTIVDVYLDGRRLASHANMYVPLEVDVSGRLGEQNCLVLHFHTVFDPDDADRRPLNRLPGASGVRVRRPKQNYGNYLGPQPYFSRVGIYDGVFLKVTRGGCLTDVVVDASLAESLAEGKIRVDAAGRCRDAAAELQVRVLAPDGSAVVARTSELRAGDEPFAAGITLSVPAPQLWWPRGYGDQPLYEVHTTLRSGGQVRDAVCRRVGFRRVTMPQRLHFVVNGVPVRLWGGDWVTPHWHTAVWDPPRVDQLFRMAEHAHFNAFRVWGVVESPRDAFYERADERGFLLWQDFTDLPLAADPASIAICRGEAEHLVRRLKHHPSIVVWCGGNEAAMWHDQEFNSRLQDEGDWPGQAAADAVGEVCRQLDPERYYQPSSPFYGIDPNDPQEGNTHGYTNLWFVPGYDYLNFAAEDTRIAAPVLHSLRRFMAPEDLWPEDYSPVFQHGDVLPYPETWRRYTTGTSWKKTGPVELFYDATDAASLVHRLGMAEALYYQETIERQRRGRAAADDSGRRRCGGYLVWKFNDSWPQIYSGKVDYFLEPYHTYYTLRNAFAPVLLSFDKAAYIHLWAVNDTREPVSGTATVQLLHPERNELRKQIERPVSLPPGASQVVVRLDQAGIGTFRKEHILYAKLTGDSGRVLAATNCLGDIERRMTFPEARLDVRVVDDALVLTSDRFARTVTLTGDADGDAFGWFFEDNYFDLMPGETRTVRVLGRHDRGRISAKAWYSPHVTEVAWTRTER